VHAGRTALNLIRIAFIYWTGRLNCVYICWCVCVCVCVCVLCIYASAINSVHSFSITTGLWNCNIYRRWLSPLLVNDQFDPAMLCKEIGYIYIVVITFQFEYIYIWLWQYAVQGDWIYSRNYDLVESFSILKVLFFFLVNLMIFFCNCHDLRL
jgi:hypothetical protein